MEMYLINREETPLDKLTTPALLELFRLHLNMLHIRESKETVDSNTKHYSKYPNTINSLYSGYIKTLSHLKEAYNDLLSQVGPSIPSDDLYLVRMDEYKSYTLNIIKLPDTGQYSLYVKTLFRIR